MIIILKSIDKLSNIKYNIYVKKFKTERIYMSQIIVKNVSLGYDGRTFIEGLDFSVNSGDYLCLVGENGSGKSTLIKALVGLKKVNVGKITTDGFSLNEIGYLPQNTDIQGDFPASVMEIVLSGFSKKMGLRPFHTKSEKLTAHNNLKKLGIEEISKKSFRELSGGQQQRVLLARALCSTSRILILDEPVTGLDPIIANELYELIARLNKEDRLTVIMVSHDIPSAVKYASHILHLGKEPLFFGTTKDYVKSDIGRSFLGGGEAK